MAMFHTVAEAPPATTHALVHELTARRIAAWLGYQPNSLVPAEMVCQVARKTPRSHTKFYALGGLVIEYMNAHPEHRFPEREATTAGASQAATRAPVIELALMAMGSPQTFYWPDLCDRVDSATRDWMMSPAGRYGASAVLWGQGYEKYPNPDEQKGRWLYRGRQTSRYRKRPSA